MIAVLLHVMIALLSVGCATITFVAPSKTKLRVSSAMVALTILSGSYVAFMTHARMLQVCASGLLYVGIVSFGLLGARRKLAIAEAAAEPPKR